MDSLNGCVPRPMMGRSPTIISASRRPSPESPASSRNKRARNVLLVDDDRAVRDVLRQIFEAGGYTCRFSGDGYDALEVFKTWRPSLRSCLIGQWSRSTPGSE